ncbi:MAG: alpha/beta fold hydrolase [Myxococcota bacterium]|nr:alpha/beta fold hydrolase [Myxococcota bacterium]
MTVLPYGLATATTAPRFNSEIFESSCFDEQRGTIPIYGRLDRVSGKTDSLVIILHGITSTPSDSYVRQLANQVNQSGMDSLRIALRGATCKGHDHYHAGQIDDLVALTTDPRLSAYENLFVVGYSLGGQIALKFGIDANETRLRGIVALCAPICMRSAQEALDKPAMLAYRVAILNALKYKYRRLMRNALRVGQPMAATRAELEKIKTFYDWDRAVVCPRFGYSSVHDYYETVSTGPELNRLEIPSLLVFGAQDPVVPLDGVADYLRKANAHSEVHVLSPGGHLGFSPRASIGQRTRPGLHHQITNWIIENR